MITLPATLPARPAYKRLVMGARLVRFYDPARGPWDALRSYGPLSTLRFDHHPPPPASSNRSVWYAANSLRGAVAETFGDLGIVDHACGRHVAVVQAVKNITVVDLVGIAARRLGLDQEIATTVNYAATQLVARALYATYATACGIRWRGRQAGSICVVLNDRTSMASLSLVSDHDLSHVAVWTRVARAARSCSLHVI